MYICIYIYIYISHIFLLSLKSVHSLRPSIHLLSSSKLAFHYNTECEIVSRIKPVICGDVLYRYLECCYDFVTICFICDMIMKES